MDHEEFQRLHQRFDKLEDKLDNHLERLSKAEEALLWMKGHLNLASALFVAAFGALVAWTLTWKS